MGLRTRPGLLQDAVEVVAHTPRLLYVGHPSLCLLSHLAVPWFRWLPTARTCLNRWAKVALVRSERQGTTSRSTRACQDGITGVMQVGWTPGPADLLRTLRPHAK